jgi:hypothetical protein
MLPPFFTAFSTLYLGHILHCSITDCGSRTANLKHDWWVVIPYKVWLAINSLMPRMMTVIHELIRPLRKISAKRLSIVGLHSVHRCSRHLLLRCNMHELWLDLLVIVKWCNTWEIHRLHISGWYDITICIQSWPIR